MNRVAVFGLLIVWVLLQPAFCAPEQDRYDQTMRVVRSISHSPNVRLLPFGRSGGGRRIPAMVISDFSIEPEVKARILICAGQHGDEYSPVRSILSLSSRLAAGMEPDLLRRCAIVVVPVVNPDGIAADHRTNSSGIDINRDWAALSSPEARHIHGIVKTWRPHLMIDMHEWTAPTRAPGNCIETPRCLLRDQQIEVNALAERVRQRTGLHVARSGVYSDSRLFHRRYSCLGHSTFLLETAYEEDYAAKNHIYYSTTIALARAVAREPEQWTALSPSTKSFSISAVRSYLEPDKICHDPAIASTTCSATLVGFGYALCLWIIKPFARGDRGRWSRRFKRCDVEPEIETSPLLMKYAPSPITARSWINRRLRSRYARAGEAPECE